MLCSGGDAAHNKSACAALKADLIALFNLIALDTFLYEEQHYNHFGHSENVLKEERAIGALFEVSIAFWILHNLTKPYKQTGGAAAAMV